MGFFNSKEDSFPGDTITALQALFLKGLDSRQKTRVLKFNAAKFLGMQRLFSVFLSPSRQCNLKCMHCYELFPEREKMQDYMATAQAKEAMQKILRLHACIVVFCSGEFLLRPDALELVSYAKSLGLLPAIVTNGSTVSPETLESLKKAGIFLMIFSLDSAESKEHDSNRGMPGLFEKAVSGIKSSAALGLNTEIWSFAMKGEKNKLEKLESLGQRLGVKRVFVFLPILSGRLFNSFEKNLSPKERNELRNRFNASDKLAVEFKKESGLCRGMGNLHVNILPNGEVTPCPPVPYSYGNIWNEDIKEIHKKIEKDFKRFPYCTGQCMVNFPEYREKTTAKFLEL
ncbi:MAG: radical SAM protein [Candidatus Diapherotrites archaeon]